MPQFTALLPARTDLAPRAVVTLSALLLVALAIPAIADEATAPPADATGFAGHHYKVFDPVDEVSWEKGRKHCVSLGGHLATVTTQAEADFIAQLSDDRYLFLGASDRDEEGKWIWVDGAKWEFTHWYKGQPNDYGGVEDYLATYDGGEWVDVEASGEDFWMPTGYICEWDD